MRISNGRRYFSWRTISIVVCAVFGFMVLSSVAAIAQQDPYTEIEPTVLPTLIEQEGEPEDEDEVLGEVVERPSVLPFTGSDLTLFVATGAALVATGTVITRLRKRRN